LLLNTKWFLPQNRERIYLVGYLGDGGGGQVFPIREGKRASDELQGQQGSACTVLARYEAGANGSYVVERKLDAQEVKILGYSRDSNGVVVNRSEKNEANTIHSSSGQGGNTDQFVKYNYGQKSLNETLQKENLSKDQVKALDLYNKKAQDDSPTLTEPHHNSLRLFEYGNIRRLTPVECERLQGFPDNWTKYGTKGEISDSQRYKMCGNAVTVDVVQAVGNKIKQIL
jgi:DNA (cytosine-5)-methyltransferase 1